MTNLPDKDHDWTFYLECQDGSLGRIAGKFVGPTQEAFAYGRDLAKKLNRTVCAWRAAFGLGGSIRLFPWDASNAKPSTVSPTTEG